MIVMVGKRDLASIAEKLIDGIDRASDALAMRRSRRAESCQAYPPGCGSHGARDPLYPERRPYGHLHPERPDLQHYRADGRYSVSRRRRGRDRPGDQADGRRHERGSAGWRPDRIGWPPPGMYDTTLSEPIFLVPGSYPASWVDITGSPV